MPTLADGRCFTHLPPDSFDRLTSAEVSEYIAGFEDWCWEWSKKLEDLYCKKYKEEKKAEEMIEENYHGCS